MRYSVLFAGSAVLAFGISLTPHLHAQDLSDSTVSSTIPFDLVSGFLAVVDGQIGNLNGLKFILDTGATHSAIDRKVAPSIPESDREKEFTKQLADALKDLTPHESSFLKADPAEYDGRVRCPALIIQGGADSTAPVRSAERIAFFMRARGNSDVIVRVFPGVSHSLLPDPVGLPSGWAALPAFLTAPDLLDEMTRWSIAKLKVERAISPNRRTASHKENCETIMGHRRRDALRFCALMERRNIVCETSRLILRRFIGGVKTLEQTRERLERWLDEYERYGFSKWAVVLRGGEELIGRCGLSPEQIDGADEWELG
jgi:hypothetical protein